MKSGNHTSYYYENYLVKRSISYADMVKYIKNFNDRNVEEDRVISYLVRNNFTKAQLDEIVNFSK